MFNRSAPPGTVVPNLCYADVEKAVAWLCDAFGFVERLRRGGGGDAQPSVELVLGDAALVVRGPSAGSGSPDDPPFRPPAPDGRSHTIMVAVDDVDAHHRRACDRGAQVAADHG